MMCYSRHLENRSRHNEWIIAVFFSRFRSVFLSPVCVNNTRTVRSSTSTVRHDADDVFDIIRMRLHPHQWYILRAMSPCPSRHGVAIPHRSRAFSSVETHPAPYGRLCSAVEKGPSRQILVRNRVHNSKSTIPSVGDFDGIPHHDTTDETQRAVVVDTQHRRRRCYHPGVGLPPRRSVCLRPWNHNNNKTRNDAQQEYNRLRTS